MASAKFDALDDEARLKRVRRSVDGARPGFVSDDSAALVTMRGAAQIVDTEVVPQFNFHIRHHTKAPAQKYTLRCKGIDIPPSTLPSTGATASRASCTTTRSSSWRGR